MSWCEGVSATDINRVGSVKGQDVALFPPPERLQPLAKLDRGAAQAGPAVRAACLAARQDLPGLGEASGLLAEEQRPEVDIVGDVEGREGGRVGHCVVGQSVVKASESSSFCLFYFVFYIMLGMDLTVLQTRALSRVMARGRSRVKCTPARRAMAGIGSPILQFSDHESR